MTKAQIAKALELASGEELARALAAKRKKPTGGVRPGAGRPRSEAKRCACGEMTLKRAKARGHKCG